MMAFAKQFLFHNFQLFLSLLSFSFSADFLPLFRRFYGYLFRIKESSTPPDDRSNESERVVRYDNLLQNDGTDPTPQLEPVQETKDDGLLDSEEAVTEESDDVFEEGETALACLKFKFPTYQEFDTRKGGQDDPIEYDRLSSGGSLSRFIERPDIESSHAEEVNLENCYGDESVIDGGVLDGGSSSADNLILNFIQVRPLKGKADHDSEREDLKKPYTDEEAVPVSVHAPAPAPGETQVPETIDQTIMEGDGAATPSEADKSRHGGEDVDFEVFQINASSDADSDSASSSLYHLRSVASSFLDSCSDNDAFLSDEDFGGEFDVFRQSYHGKEPLDDHMYDEYHESDEEDSDIMEELRSLEEEQFHHQKFLSEKDFKASKQRFKDGEVGGIDDEEAMNGQQDPGKPQSSRTESERSKKLESLWEHQDLIEQLKMELKKVRATGLPTILEESESPKIMEDLKPWKIDDKFDHEDCMGELHKFYKSYRERMRKFDIFNYQKMYAIGFLQLKEPLESTSNQKPSFTGFKSVNLGLAKRRIHGSEPMTKFVRELQGDLEVVYVGQMCLSWEILQWQYDKALDLWESDARGIHRYNEVAGEFQQFQVLMQRFIEDEPFQGPRVQIYVKNRCILRNLLQVPLVREDNLRERKKSRTRESGEYAITSDALVEIIEESIRIFWRFVRADKDSSIGSIKGRRWLPSQLQDSSDARLFAEVLKDLQKKHRKLRDLLRSENCILKKFRACREDNTDQVLYFFSQVDLKLVSRVLNMPRLTTDQLVWCRSKLSKISFVNKSRKINVEPSFLLFPC